MPQELDYFEGEVIVKIKPQFSQKCTKSNIAISSIQKIIANESVGQVEKMFPKHQKE